MDHIPLFSEDLIAKLDKAVPCRWPIITESERSIWFQAGQRALVDSLKEVFKRQLADAVERSDLNVR